MVDTAVGFPKSREDMFEFYEFIRKGSHDSATKEGELEFPAGYMFKNVPKWESDDMGDPVEMLFLEHQRHGITQAIVGRRGRGRTARAVRELPDHFFAGISIDPNEGMEAVRKIDRYANEFDLKSVGAFPLGPVPAGRDERQEVLSDLREVHRARRRVLLDRGRARARGCSSRRRKSRSSTRCAGSSPS